MNTKVCIKCGIEKDENEFYDAKGKNVKKPKKINTCKECFNRITHNHTKIHYEERKQRHAAYLEQHPNETKKCRICNKELLLKKFAFHATKGDLMSSECRECRLKHAKNRSLKKKSLVESIFIPKWKVCKRCGLTKEIDAFNFHYGKKDLHRNECKDCQKEWSKEYYKTIAVEEREKRKLHYKNNPKEAHNRHLMGKFKISRIDYERMLREQDGKCAICGSDKPSINGKKPKHFAVDHDHITGNVRALLCTKCNAGLGNYKDSPSLLRKAARYLESFINH